MYSTPDIYLCNSSLHTDSPLTVVPTVPPPHPNIQLAKTVPNKNTRSMDMTRLRREAMGVEVTSMGVMGGNREDRAGKVVVDSVIPIKCELSDAPCDYIDKYQQRKSRLAIEIDCLM